MNESGGFLDWKLGQKPNTVLLYIGYCCCCGFPLMFQIHAFRNAFKARFIEIDDNMHWLYVIIGFIGLYQNDKQLGEIEKLHNISVPAASLPWWLPLFLPILWPMAVASQMNRLNALNEAIKK